MQLYGYPRFSSMPQMASASFRKAERSTFRVSIQGLRSFHLRAAPIALQILAAAGYQVVCTEMFVLNRVDRPWSVED